MLALNLFATAPIALAPMLANELTELGAARARVLGAGVAFSANLSMAYRVCLWSRLASRVLLPIGEAAAADGDELYHGAREVDWSAHLDTNCTFAVDCTVRNARITHSHYAALRVKDAIVDQFRDNEGRRPSIDTDQPDIRIHVHLQGRKAQLAIDLSGGGLHRRGYRVEAGIAPLRETLAAAMLRFTGWPNSRRFEMLLDPLCGSATLPIEAALMAGDIAPGLNRTHFGFLSWPSHETSVWQALVDEALERRARGAFNLPPIVGSDHDASVMSVALRNVQRAGLARNIELRTCTLDSYERGKRLRARGLLVANPPYGPRMEQNGAAQCAQQLRTLCNGALSRWTKTILMPDVPGWPLDGGAQHASDAAVDTLAVNNGALACRVFTLKARPRQKPGMPQVAAPLSGVVLDTSELTNRIAKNERKLRPWRKRETVSCYRIYDADLPQFALAIDIYQTTEPEQRWVLVQEYAAPSSIDPALAATRREAALAILPEALGVERERVLFKTRERQRGATQYQRQQRLEQYRSVVEGGCTLQVNLHDFVDTGLFLDHRPLRRWIREHSHGARFLNLFGYTGSASVHAAAGGAVQTLTVDMSAAYLQWCERNLQLNDFHPPDHDVLRTDCITWLASEDAKAAGPFDLIFLDPPTFSNSKRMSDSFDVQRDHVALIRSALAIMQAQGTLLFSSNRRGMRLDEAALHDLSIKDWTKPSVPVDFAHRSTPHQCWMIRKPA
jgi:23S rRNA (guanine2445-N2)-methyltransferase / 23S rRNA (guanine2069-N7)-methyltransferase